MTRRAWTEEERAYLREHFPTTATLEIATALGRTVFMVSNQAYKMGLKKTAEHVRAVAGFQKGSTVGTAFQFPKGHVPANKGARRPGWAPGRMATTQFKTGEMAGAARAKWKPVGTIMPDSEGYLRIKLREREPGKEPGWNSKVWRLLHWHTWEQAHGPIPPKHIVTFKDGNRANCGLENLQIMSMADNARRNHMWKTLPPELAAVIQLNGVLKRKLRRMEEQHGTQHDQRPA